MDFLQMSKDVAYEYQGCHIVFNTKSLIPLGFDLYICVIKTIDSIFYIELFAAFFGIIYSFLMARKFAIGWLIGAVSCALLAYVSFEHELYFQVLVQGINVGMGIWGYVQWKNTSHGFGSLSKKTSVLLSVLNLGLTAVLMALYSKHLLNWTQTMDVVTLILSLTGTFLTIFKFKDSWYYWIAVNLFTGILVFGVHLYFFAGLSVLYLLVSLYGLYEWNRNEKQPS